MKIIIALPVHHVLEKTKLEKVDDFVFNNIGDSHELIANEEKVIDVRHTGFTGQPHPRYLIFPEGSTTTFQLRDDMLIWIQCDKKCKCEGEHGHSGPYQVFDIEANKEFWISGEENNFFRPT